jgi:hypothetical protein
MCDSNMHGERIKIRKKKIFKMDSDTDNELFA